MSPNRILVIWGALATTFGVSTTEQTDFPSFLGLLKVIFSLCVCVCVQRFHRMHCNLPQMHYHWMQRKIKSKSN